MIDKIMFGTDWYMILSDKLGYRAWYEDTITALGHVQEALGGQYSAHYLFHQFAIINPLRFYRLGKILDRLKGNLTTAIGKLGDEGGVEKARPARRPRASTPRPRRRRRRGSPRPHAGGGQAGGRCASPAQRAGRDPPARPRRPARRPARRRLPQLSRRRRLRVVRDPGVSPRRRRDHPRRGRPLPRFASTTTPPRCSR
jgi:hypothetical protein